MRKEPEIRQYGDVRFYVEEDGQHWYVFKDFLSIKSSNITYYLDQLQTCWVDTEDGVCRKIKRHVCVNSRLLKRILQNYIPSGAAWLNINKKARFVLAEEKREKDEAQILIQDILGDPTAEEATTEEPITEEPITEEPIIEEPATEEPATEEPDTEEPATEEPDTEEPITEEPATEEPNTEEPVIEEPATEEPITANLTTEKTVNEELFKNSAEYKHEHWISEREQGSILGLNLFKPDNKIENKLYYVRSYKLNPIASMDLMLLLANQAAERGDGVFIFSLNQSEETLLEKSIDSLSITLLNQNPDLKTMHGVGTKWGNSESPQSFQALRTQSNEKYKEFSKNIYLFDTFVGFCSTIEANVKDYIANTGKKPVVIIDSLETLARSEFSLHSPDLGKTIIQIKKLSRELKIPVFLTGLADIGIRCQLADLNITLSEIKDPTVAQQDKDSDIIWISADIQYNRKWSAHRSPLTVRITFTYNTEFSCLKEYKREIV